jgi:hypothetical protein
LKFDRRRGGANPPRRWILSSSDRHAGNPGLPSHNGCCVIACIQPSI